MSKPFILDKEDWIKIGRVVIYSFLSASTAIMIAILASPDVHMPVWVVPLVPAINAGLYGLNRWIGDNR